MSHSPYAVNSALDVPCPPRDGVIERGCGAERGQKCRSFGNTYQELFYCHPARRRLADAKRTVEVHPELVTGAKYERFVQDMATLRAMATPMVSSIEITVTKDTLKSEEVARRFLDVANDDRVAMVKVNAHPELVKP
jgi:hypothetical protein